MRTGELYVRGSQETIERAPEEDNAVLRSYLTTPTRGPLVEGHRITILSARDRYRVGEEIRVVHVLEIVEPGAQLWVMGPKALLGEHLDGHLVTGAVPTNGAFAPLEYDGVVLPSPNVDFNFEMTRYRFDAPGVHRVEWRAGRFSSNVLCVTITP